MQKYILVAAGLFGIMSMISAVMSLPMGKEEGYKKGYS